MLVLVTYDVSTEDEKGKKRLRRIAKLCESYGQRVQNSVFECLVDPRLWSIFSHKLLSIMDPTHDSLRFYFLGKNWKGRIEHFGAKASYDPEGLLVI